MICKEKKEILAVCSCKDVLYGDGNSFHFASDCGEFVDLSSYQVLFEFAQSNVEGEAAASSAMVCNSTVELGPNSRALLESPKGEGGKSLICW